jgi:uncharacterized protein YdbL (DUF1318 family)
VKVLGWALMAGLIAGAAPVRAQEQSQGSLRAARALGQVGERFDGYMGAPKPLNGIVRSQLDSVNIQRRSLFTGFAARRGVSPGDVGVTAGCTLLARVAVGEVYLLPDNVWRRRVSGEAAPRPDYCPGG